MFGLCCGSRVFSFVDFHKSCHTSSVSLYCLVCCRCSRGSPLSIEGNSVGVYVPITCGKCIFTHFELSSFSLVKSNAGATGGLYRPASRGVSVRLHYIYMLQCQCKTDPCNDYSVGLIREIPVHRFILYCSAATVFLRIGLKLCLRYFVKFRMFHC